MLKFLPVSLIQTKVTDGWPQLCEHSCLIAANNRVTVSKATDSEGKYILYAEDDMDDRMIFQTLLQQISPNLGSVIVDNGVRIIDYLNAIPENDSYPCFILLDINMPVMDGFAALKILKNHAEWKEIPVILYTTSNYLSDLKNAELYGAEKIITKPFSMEDIRRVITDFASYCIKLPELKK